MPYSLAKLRWRLGITHDPYQAGNQDHFPEQVDPEYEQRTGCLEIVQYARAMPKQHMMQRIWRVIQISGNRFP